MLPSFLPLECQGEKVLHFCSEDYFGFSEHPEVKKRIIRFFLHYGLFSPKISHVEHPITSKFSSLLERETILFLPSHFEALHAVLATFSAQNRQILADSACQISYPSISYRHCDLIHLQERLQQQPKIRKLIVAESTFAATAAHADLLGLIELAQEYSALLVIEDSHSFGIRGFQGLGPCSLYQEIDFVIGSLDKACGLFGGYIACSCAMRDLLLESMPTPFYLLPPFLGALDFVIEKLPSMEGERNQLQQSSYLLRQQLCKMGWEVAPSDSPIISLQMETWEEANHLYKLCKTENLLINPPYFIEGEIKPYRCNFSITIAHTLNQINQLLEVVQRARLEFPRV